MGFIHAYEIIFSNRRSVKFWAGAKRGVYIPGKMRVFERRIKLSLIEALERPLMFENTTSKSMVLIPDAWPWP